MKRIIPSILILQLIGQTTFGMVCTNRVYRDASRDREIPVVKYSTGDVNSPKQLIIISPGYGVDPSEYSYIAENLICSDCLVVSIQHDLPIDAPLPVNGNLYNARNPVWMRGVHNIRFVISKMREQYKTIKTIIVIGHSNGGDISALFAQMFPEEVSQIITMDHRRVPIPRQSSPRFLSIRATQFPADSGVLPEISECHKYGIQIIEIAESKHMDFVDKGSSVEISKVISHLNCFLGRTQRTETSIQRVELTPAGATHM